jgi:hypothetical protein
MFAREVHGVTDVCGSRAAGDQCGPPVEQAVPYPAPGVVGRIACEKQLSAQPRGEILDRLARQVDVGIVERARRDVADTGGNRGPAAQRCAGR